VAKEKSGRWTGAGAKMDEMAAELAGSEQARQAARPGCGASSAAADNCRCGKLTTMRSTGGKSEGRRPLKDAMSRPDGKLTTLLFAALSLGDVWSCRPGLQGGCELEREGGEDSHLQSADVESAKVKYAKVGLEDVLVLGWHKNEGSY
jgi:hypothetical protein